MPLHSSLPAPTKAQVRLHGLIRDGGCVACLLAGRSGVPPEINHLLDGGRKISHDHVIGLCAWCHRGEPGPISKGMATDLMGPSLALRPRAFHERYGSDQELLARQYELIGQPAPVWPVSKILPRPVA